MAVPLGGGSPKKIIVHVGAKRVRHEVSVRLGLWGVPSIGVITGADGAGQLVVYNHDVQAWQIVASVFHAIRQAWHILFQYGTDIGYGEKRKMARAAALARELNLTVLGCGRPHADIGALRTQTRGAIHEASKLLGTPRKPSKQEAAAQLASLASGTDQRGRANPGVAMARTVVTREHVLHRLEREVLEIDPNIVRRQRALIQLVQYAEQVILNGVRHFLENMLTDIGMAQLADPQIRRRVTQHLHYLASDLDRLDFAPYREACSLTMVDLLSAADLLGSSEPLDESRNAELKHALGRAAAAMELKVVQLGVERLLYTLMRDGGRPDFAADTFGAEIHRLLNLLEAVDESSFRVPVRDIVLPHLLTALGAISKRDSIETKEALKAASAAL